MINTSTTTYSKHNNRYNKEELLKLLIDYFNNTGKIPSSKLCCKNGWPSQNAFLTKFGTFQNAIIEANIPIPNKYEHNATCDNITCGITFYRKPSQLNKTKSGLNFCSEKCSHVWLSSYHSNIKLSDPNTKISKQAPYSRVSFRECKSCKKYFRNEKNQRRCNACIHTTNQNNISVYRRSCKFKLNNRDHSELFDSELIKQYGWYSPSNKGNNLTGLTWDHLYRIEEGFKNQISPDILSHPANAELVPMTVNQSRRTSTITYDELLQRIAQWDSGDRNLKKYFILPKSI